MLDPQAVVALAAQCAPDVAPATLLAVARAESGLNPLAIGVNGARGGRPAAKTAAEAAAAAKALVADGRDIDLGLAQINVRNLARLGLSIETAFEPCRNLAAAAQVLREGYARGQLRHGPGQAALRVALSVYNTGHAERGFRDQGRRLSTGRNDPHVVRDLVGIAQHRGWTTINVRGHTEFRREVWLMARAAGLEVRGYRPTERDDQQAERHRNAAPRPGASTLDSRDRLRVVEAVVRNRVVEPAEQARILASARSRLAQWLERGAQVGQARERR